MDENLLVDGPRPRLVNFSADGARAWQNWYDALGAEIDEPGRSEREAGLLSKFVGVSARLALIVSRLRLADEPGSDLGGPVEPPDVEGASRLVRYFEAMRARMTFVMNGGAGSPAAARIVAWLSRKQLMFFTRSDLRSDLRRSLSDTEMDQGLKLLVGGNALRPVDEPGRLVRCGRRPSDKYEVNPELFASFCSPPNCADEQDRATVVPKNVITVNTGANSKADVGARGRGRRAAG
jgi:hypothetical protein